MIRQFVVAFVTIIAISTGLLEAQVPRPPGGRIPVNVAGGAPGVSVQFFMDAGKLADATVDTTGSLNWLLDLSNTPKTKVTIYVDVCKDGKIVKVMFVTGSGQAPPKDDDCERRVTAVSFQSDCGITSINLDFRNFGARVVGCGGILSNKTLIGTVGGVVVGAFALTTGGGGTTTPTATSTPTVTSSTPPATTTAPPPSTTPPSTPPSSTPPRVTANGRYRCVGVSIVRDDGRHNVTINLGPQLTGDFVVTEGSITIRHPAPFIDIVNAQFDTASGAFSGEARGTVAGFPNVGVRATGTVSTANGQITMIYTMGTGGELPGGQPITYSITLQKQ